MIPQFYECGFLSIDIYIILFRFPSEKCAKWTLYAEENADSGFFVHTYYSLKKRPGNSRIMKWKGKSGDSRDTRVAMRSAWIISNFLVGKSPSNLGKHQFYHSKNDNSGNMFSEKWATKIIRVYNTSFGITYVTLDKHNKWMLLSSFRLHSRQTNTPTMKTYPISDLWCSLFSLSVT